MFKIALQVNKPCSEDWQQMQPITQGRYCKACQSQVIDFTTWSEEELKAFFSRYQKSKVCGRFKEKQLKAYSLTSPASYWIKNITASLVGLAAFTGFGSRDAQAGAVVKTPMLQLIQTVADTTKPASEASVVSIKGLVRDSIDNLPIPGVMVEEKGTSNKTLTDIDGRFELKISKEAGTRLLISFIGYETKEIVPVASQMHDIKLETTFHPEGVTLTPITVGGVFVKVSPLRRMWWKIKHLFN